MAKKRETYAVGDQVQLRDGYIVTVVAVYPDGYFVRFGSARASDATVWTLPGLIVKLIRPARPRSEE